VSSGEGASTKCEVRLFQTNVALLQVEIHATEIPVQCSTKRNSFQGALLQESSAVVID